MQEMYRYIIPTELYCVHCCPLPPTVVCAHPPHSVHPAILRNPGTLLYHSHVSHSDGQITVNTYTQSHPAVPLIENEIMAINLKAHSHAKTHNKHTHRCAEPARSVGHARPSMQGGAGGGVQISSRSVHPRVHS